VFDRLGLDCCCGGQRSLADAAADHGLALPDVVAALDALPVDPAATAPAWELRADLEPHLPGRTKYRRTVA